MSWPNALIHCEQKNRLALNGEVRQQQFILIDIIITRFVCAFSWVRTIPHSFSVHHYCRYRQACLENVVIWRTQIGMSRITWKPIRSRAQPLTIRLALFQRLRSVGKSRNIENSSHPIDRLSDAFNKRISTKSSLLSPHFQLWWKISINSLIYPFLDQWNAYIVHCNVMR